MASKNTLEILIMANDRASGLVDGITKSIAGNFNSMAKSMLKNGALLGAATAPFIAGMKTAVSAATDFDESMTNVGAVLGKSKDEMVGLNAEVLALGAASRAGPQAAADAFYDIVGGVVDSSTHMAILESAIATAEAGSADLGATTNALISIMNSYSFGAEKAAFASDVLTQTVGAGVGTMDQFAAALPQVAGLAASLGIGFDSLGASMAWLTTKGYSASQSATQLRAMMVAMLNPNAKMTQALEEAGFASGTLAIEQLGLVGAFQELSNASPTFQDNMAGAVGSVEALNGVIALTDESFAQFEKDFVASAEGATDAARKIQLDSFAAQMDLLRSSVEALKIQIGLALLPMLTRMVRGITQVTSTLGIWASEHTRLIRFIGITVGILAGFAAASMTLGAALIALPAVFGALTSAAGILGMAIAGIAVSFNGISPARIQKITSVLDMLFRSFKTGLTTGDFTSFKNVFDFFIGNELTARIDRIRNILKSLSAAFKLGLSTGDFTAFKTMFDYLTHTHVFATIDTFIGTASEKAQAIRDALGVIGNAFKAPIMGLGAETILPSVSAGPGRELMPAFGTAEAAGYVEQIQTVFSSALETAFNDPAGFVANIDLSPVGDLISTHFVDVIKVALPIVLTGGFGGVAVAAVIRAFDTDFMGFRTELENSGVITTIEDGVQGIKDAIVNALGFGPSEATTLSAGLGKQLGPAFDISGDPASGLSTLIDSLKTSLQPLADLLSGAWAAIAPGLVDLKDGIVGFIQAFEGTETGNIGEALKTIAEGIAVLMGAFVAISADLIGDTLSAIGDNLPALGKGISKLISAVDALLGGDFGGALKTLGEGIASIIGALVGYETDLLDNFVNSLANLAGIDLTALKEDAGSIGQGILDGITNLFENLDFAMWLQENVLAKIAGGLAIVDLSLMSGQAMRVGAEILLGIADNFLDLATWIDTNLITPIGTAISDAAQTVLDFGKTLGANIINGLLEALKGIGQTVLDFIKLEIAKVGDASILGVSANRLFDFLSDPVAAVTGQARGGPVAAGAPYVVGEKGPELFVPTRSGTIIPNNQLTASGGGRSAGGAFYDFSGAQIYTQATNGRDLLNELEDEAKRRGKTLLTPRGVSP